MAVTGTNAYLVLQNVFCLLKFCFRVMAIALKDNVLYFFKVIGGHEIEGQTPPTHKNHFVNIGLS